MPLKANIKNNKDSIKNMSLDNSYELFLKKFKNIELNILPENKTYRKILFNEYNNNDIICNFNEKLDIKNLIKNIDKKINELKNLKKKYLLNNSEYIFTYFENKKSLSLISNNNNNIDNFFNIKNSNTKITCKNTLSNIEKYFQNIDSTCYNETKYYYDNTSCKYCEEGEMIPIDYEGLLICNKCYSSEKFLIEYEKPTYKEPPKEVTFYAYKRINHFREILAQFQAKETTLISDSIINNIKSQIIKERLDIENTNNKSLKEVLKKLKYNKYYEHIPFIKDKLGVKPPVMSSELENTLCNLFIDIQAPYSKYCPEFRVNFLNYYYTIYKFCELLNERQFLPFFPMLKDREKRIEQDEIWKKICEDLNWKFIPTL